MLGFYISLPFLLFALYRLFVVLYNFFSRPFLPSGNPVDNPLVSILVYAQNSEKSIGKLLQGLKEQTHQNFEVLIYNDQSTDKTIDVISEISAGDKRFRLFNGSEVNAGWQNKNYAYEKLVQIAKGQHYIFSNSDLVIDSQFVANTLSHMQRRTLSLMTIYPKFHSQRFGVRLQISAVQWMFFSLFSAKSFLIKRAGESFSFANPMLIVEATSYKTNKWFEKFKDAEFPELDISSQQSGEVLLGDNSLTFNVDDLYSSTSQYFELSVKKFFINRNSLIAYSIAVGLGLIFAIFLMPFPLVFLYLFALIYSQMLIALLNQQSVILSLLIMPIQYFVLVKGLIMAIKKSDK